MSRSFLGICCAAIILLAARAALPAQTLPAFDQFDGNLRTCAAGQNIALSADLSASIRQIYDGQDASGFADFTKFLSRIPEKDQPEAYRLYVECITNILGNTKVSPPPTTVTYRVCSGEYEKSCQKHDAYLYCGDDVAAWAKLRCTSSTVQRLGAYGGNKCGYSLDAVICAGPRQVHAAVQHRRRPPACRIRHGVRICAGSRQAHPAGHHRRRPPACVRYGVDGKCNAGGASICAGPWQAHPAGPWRAPCRRR
jgi:hypothetical protein